VDTKFPTIGPKNKARRIKGVNQSVDQSRYNEMKKQQQISFHDDGVYANNYQSNKSLRDDALLKKNREEMNKNIVYNDDEFYDDPNMPVEE
jgi:hypothetical protein